MKAFATLLDRLVYTPQRSGKERLLGQYFRTATDPGRGYALAALSDGLPLSFPVRRVLTDLAQTRFDAELFRLSRDYVGDTAETLALIWDAPAALGDGPRLSDIVAALQAARPADYTALVAGWLDELDASGRWALLKFLGGAPRVGVSARMVKVALAAAYGRTVEEIEELWHGLSPPYLPLFLWLEGRAEKPAKSNAPVFRPLMLAHPMEAAEWDAMDLSQHAVEWKWDGIRVQVAGQGGMIKLFSRSGDDITAAFPDVIEGWQFDAVLDGELLVVRDGMVAPFADLQQRLNRKTVTRALQAQYPAHVRFYDVLEIAGEDVRQLPFTARRQRLEAFLAAADLRRSDVSEILSFASKDALQAAWADTRQASIEGVMIKRLDSSYLTGRPKGHWYKWKRAPLSADCVMMYAQRGSGKRSSFYSDFTFGVWTELNGQRQLVPVGKSYSGFTDAEMRELDKFVRDNTTERFGPVRAVAPRLVLEVVFDAVQRSSRHKSGVAMRFPRIARIRWDKPAAEADDLETVARLIA